MADSINQFFNLIGKTGVRMTETGAPTISDGFIFTKKSFTPPDTKLSTVYRTNSNFRTPFIAPQNTLSQNYKQSQNPISSGSTQPTTKSSSLGLSETTRSGGTRIQQPGFTPISYYRTSDGQALVVPPQNKVRTFDESLKSSKDSFIKSGDSAHGSFKYTLDDYNLFNPDGANTNPWEKTIDQNPLRLQRYPGTPYDNEDPVYFGFEIVINTLSSPLFNGELEEFIDKFGADNSEIEYRRPLINQFKNEMKRYFRFDTEMGVAEKYNPDELIWTTNLTGVVPKKFLPENRIYYVKKVGGLDKLTESNGPDAPASFINYPTEKLTITFYEDVTLNIGTLASLYKSIYWSRLRGKSIIPENLLRFDCEIILFDLRNLVRMKKTNNILEYFKDNLSRYKYKVYECQFWFTNLPHPNDVDMSQVPTTFDNYTIDINYKFSTMQFERYDPTSLMYKIMYNVDGSISDGPDNNKEALGNHDGLVNSNLESSSQPYLSEIPIPEVGDIFRPVSTDDLELAKQEDKNSIYRSNFVKNGSSDLLQGSLFRRSIYEQIPKEDFEIPTGSDRIYSATEILIQNLKRAGLREAQRALNERFRLLNNSLDRVRNSFGIGRMTAPTNVYDISNNGSVFFFDVKNSLRNFGGDVLLSAMR